MKGLFITFEGGEGAGKTTLIEAIAQQLSSERRSVLKTREPGGTPLGEEIREILLKPRKEKLSPYAELSLFLASRAQHIQELIQPALSLGKVVLCDRFNDSSIAYQGMARGLGMEKVASFCQIASAGVTPQITFYLDIDPEIGLKRAKSRHTQDRIEAEELSFHKKIREGYLLIAKKESSRFCVLDAEESPETVFQKAMELIYKHV